MGKTCPPSPDLVHSQPTAVFALRISQGLTLPPQAGSYTLTCIAVFLPHLLPLGAI